MSAVISKCGLHRYLLERESRVKPLVFVMLNPSKADAEPDDPTIGLQKLRQRPWVYRYSRCKPLCLQGNNPVELGTAKDPVGIDNDAYILKVCKDSDVCCAWDANAKF